MSHYEIPPFTDKGDPVTYDRADGPADGKAPVPVDSRTLLSTGPRAEFKNVNTMSDGTHTKGIYWDGSDIPGRPKMGTWLTEDVPDLMKANFRTIKDRAGWGFMGSSTGGFASLKAVLKHPDKFKAAIANGLDIVPDSPLWKGHEQEMRENNPQVLARKLAATEGPDVCLAFQVGTKENPRTMTDVRTFMTTYGKGPVHTKLWEIPGGTHNGATYGRNMAGPMQWISDQLEGPTPSS
ncbi:esterase family protein [Streptomyces sp. UNOB3_S3]|uniref:alpha/beta hydrolase n=1 Tax=Streptomyces sp. UNOB3_S3 TaxID=2871682 RepID=UPI001E4222D2|nr:alpha/beta hydrolase-fold protein [Streptomyces sp. UNOB3_S3]MCC3776063.1 esterase family protein [Streptomyces sp. UNOB3_S3]